MSRRDGTTQQVSLDLSDWTLNANGASPSDGNIEAANTPYRNSVAGQAQTIKHLRVLGELPMTGGKTGQPDVTRLD